ncbi:thiol-activated cytolysin [Capnocytophaga cynodegmi]|uniref:Thiol-activated cytolysin n=1 Tax=Capnocytophaga cynodegmi TaxID=28189 RepID=A0A250E5J5_9FLAO|nr:thiol-activated cytolysin family protein [Capnocytophaga cynodegmi]ATA68051.1 thiol-activated cytolysin [Capnocytophaga cynodegmi]
MQTQISVKAALLALSSTVLFSCQKESDNVNDSNSNLNAFVSALPSVKQIEPFSERLVSSEQGQNLFGRLASSDPILVSGKKKEYEQALQVEEQLLFSEDQEIFYPGALLKAKTVVEGSYAPIVTPRKPLTISTSLIGDKTSFTVENPKLSTVRDGVSSLLTRNFDTPAANITYSYEEVHSESHLKIALGAGYNGTSTSVKGNFSFNKEDKKTRYVVKIQQVFYTLDLDLPEKPSDFFPDNFDYSQYLANEKEKPLFISSIKMGRVLLLGIESTLSKTDVEAKLNASFLGGKITAEAEAAFKELSQNSTIRGRVLGGNSALAGQTISDIEQVKNFLKEGASFSRQNPGIPISYKMRELGTNLPFKTVIYSKYLKTDSSPNANKKLDFRIFFGKQDLETITGEVVSRLGKSYIERKSAKSTAQGHREEVKFYTNDKHIIRNIKSLEKDEKIVFIFDRSEAEDNLKGEFIFELPSFDDLVNEAERATNENRNMYDKEKGNPLKIKDKTNRLILILELEDQKVY